MWRLCSLFTASNPRARIEALYECLAPLYVVVHPFVRAVAARAAGLLGVGDGAAALDVCTGTGVVAEALACRGYAVTGVDIAAAMLAQRRRIRAQHGIASVRMDARRLAFPDRSFDVCAISMGLHEFPPEDRLRILQEMRRVSRRYVLVADYTGRQPWVVRVAEWLEASHFNDFIDSSLDAQLTAAGLTVVRRDRWLTIGLFLCEVPPPRPGGTPTPGPLSAEDPIP